MKRTYAVVILICLVGLFACDRLDKSVHNMKDLDENMIDLRLYHENLGDAIVHENQDIALWLEGGMDSVLRVLSVKFKEHRKLSEPFGKTYSKDLEPPIKDLHGALLNKNWSEARSAYTLVTKKCNGCHRDNDIDKEVQNWLNRRH